MKKLIIVFSLLLVAVACQKANPYDIDDLDNIPIATANQIQQLDSMPNGTIKIAHGDAYDYVLEKQNGVYVVKAQYFLDYDSTTLALLIFLGLLAFIVGVLVGSNWD